MTVQEVYVSTDVESDGPLPGVNSMLSFGSAAFLADKTLVSTFSANLVALEGAVPDPETMTWWQGQQEAFFKTRQSMLQPSVALPQYVAWLKSLPGKPVFVGYPAGYDFLFIYWYLIRFAGESPFSFSALDIRTFAMATLKCDWQRATKKHMPSQWFDEGRPHTHVALDDAIEQGALFCNMLAKSRQG